MKNRWWVAALAALALLAAGCHNSGNKQNSTNMRSVNAVVDAEPLDVLVDDDVKHAAVKFGATTSYSQFDSGGRDVKIRSSTNQSVLLDRSLNFGSGANYTLIAYGKRAAMNALLLTDDSTSPTGANNFKVRVVGLSPESGAVDVYIAAGDITSIPPTISNVGFGSTTDYVEGANGNYRIIFATSGTKEIVFQSTPQSFTSGEIATVLVFPGQGGKLVNAVLLTSGSNASGTFLQNPLARVKAVNAIPDSTTLNFKADGAVLLSNVPFGGGSSYVTTNAGARNLALEASNVPGTNIATLTQTLDPAKDYSILAVNNLAQAQLVVLTDDNTAPPAGTAKIRFTNALVGSTTVDVLVNFASQAQGIPYKGASAYYSLAPSTTYTITFATPGGINVIATLTPVELDAGFVYTAILTGSGTNAQVRLMRER